MNARLIQAVTTIGLVLLFCLPRPVAAQAAVVCDGLEQALSLFNEGKQDEAYPFLRKLSAGKCDQPIVYVFQGAYERGKGHLKDAANTFRQGLTHDAANITLLLELAVTYSWTNRLPDAVATYRSVLAIDPANTTAKIGVARVLGWMGRRDAAMEGFQAVLAEHTGNVEALLGLAAVQLAAFKTEEARANYAHVLNLAPDHREALDGLRRVEAFTRVEVSAAAVVGLIGGQRIRTLAVTTAYQLTPTVGLSAGLNTVAADPVTLDFANTSRIAPVMASPEQRLGLSWRINPLTSVALASQARRVNGRMAFSGSIDANRTLSRRLSLDGAVRSIPGDDGVTVMTSGGLSLAATKAATLSVTGFYSTLASGTSRALAHTLRANLWRGTAASGTVAVGSQGGSTFLSVSGSVVARLSSAATLGLDGTSYRGQYRSVRLIGTLTARF